VEFPQIGVLPYMLTLAGHGFYWFELSKPAPETIVDEHEEWESATSSAVADSLLAAGVVHAAEDMPGDSDQGEPS
jgi:maltose alpha-D-glucosyltransferase/alpha-amylase